MIDRSRFRDTVRHLAAYAHDVISQGPTHPHFRSGKPEDNTKDKIIVPLLDAMGYTAPDFRTLETAVGKKWVDYSLHTEVNRPPMIFVEAKPVFEESLWDRHKGQIYKYIQEYRISSLEEEPVKWIVLTNGFEFYILRLNDREPHWRLTLSEETSNLLFDLLVRSNVRDGVLDATYIEQRKETLGKQFLEDLKLWRLFLANGFHHKQPDLSVEQLSSASQVYLNRLLFIRMLETYRLRPTTWLGGLYSHWKDAGWEPSVHQFAKEILRAFSDTEFRFNTELFKENLCDQLQIDDEFVEAVIVSDMPVAEMVRNRVATGPIELWARTIYNYDFTELGVDVLGSVYERFLAHQFAISNNKVVIQGTEDPVQATKLRRKEGIYYTPGWVTKFIVRSCLAVQLNNILAEAVEALERNQPDVGLETIKRAASIKVADIAMGSGSFLLQVFELLYEMYERYNDAIRSRRKALTESAERPDLTELMKWAFVDDPGMLALDSLYGVDLDPQAVSLAKLNLWLRLLSKNVDRYRTRPKLHHLLPRLDLHFRQGNSLITASRLSNFHSEAAARRSAFAEVHRLFLEAKSNPDEEKIQEFIDASTRLSDEMSNALLSKFFGPDVIAKHPLVLEVLFPYCFLQSNGTLLSDGGFDAVVGNPPYEVLSWRERGIAREEEAKEKAFLDEAYATRSKNTIFIASSLRGGSTSLSQKARSAISFP